MRLKHPNIVQCLGATTSPLQIVADLMSNGEVMNYTRRNPDADRVHLVSSLVLTGKSLLAKCDAITLGIGLNCRTRLPPFPWGDSWGFETGWYLVVRPFVQPDTHQVKAKRSRERQG